MKATNFSAAVGAVGIVSLSLSGLAQTPGGTSTQPQSQTATPTTQNRTASGQTVTIVGCVQRESDYRKAHDAGRGGVVGTGIGAGNEFVLISASMSSGSAGAPAPSGKSAGTVTAGATLASAYELSGPNEGKLAPHVNKRVEITGMMKAAEVGASGTPTGGPTAGAPPRGVDVASKDLKLREVEVVSVKEVTGNCPAAQ